MTQCKSGYIIRAAQQLFSRSGINRLLVLVLLLSVLLIGCARRNAVPVVPQTTETPQTPVAQQNPSVPAPPGQPTTGPGGSNYTHGSVIKNEYGSGATRYWIFEPASPEPASAPVIVFNHGWIAVDPSNYGAWIEHLVRQGNIVIYPAYQESSITNPDDMTQNAIDAVKDALQRIQGSGKISPELDKFAIVGHSLGGGIAANMAALSVSTGLPEPKALMLPEPGDGGNIGAHILLNDLSTIPSTTMMIVVVGSDDTIAGTDIGRRIFNGTPQIQPSNKEFITIFSDEHGEPPLLADHYAPVAPDTRYGEENESVIQSRIRQGIHQFLGADVNALDYYGFWKLMDGLIDDAFYGKDREYAFGDTQQQRFMGKWSDGEPVKELELTKSP
jgi:acetyl esterase/lipase